MRLQGREYLCAKCSHSRAGTRSSCNSSKAAAPAQATAPAKTAGHAKAQTMLGVHLEEGIGLPGYRLSVKDAQEAVLWYFG